MAGPAANMASILVIRQRMGTRTLVAYLAAIVAGAVLAGFGIDYLLPREWFTENLEQLESGTEIATDVEIIEPADDEQIVKFIKNDKVYILRRGQIYTILGQRVQ
jgi:hypothetical protein